MKIEYEINVGSNLARITFVGLYNFPDFSTGYSSMLGDPGFIAGMNVLWNAREMDMTNIQLSDIMQFAEFTRPFVEQRGKGKSACVVNSKSQHSVARLFELGAKQDITSDFRIFDSIKDAEIWLETMSQ